MRTRIMRGWGLVICLFVVACSTSPLPELNKVNTEEFVPAVKDEVERAYQSVQDNPEEAAANGELGMILHAHKQHQAAMVAYRRAHLLAPDEFSWLYLLGILQAAEAEHEDAVATLREASERRPAYPPVQLRLADSLLELGRIEEAASVYEEVNGAETHAAAAWYGLGRTHSATGDHEAAAEAFRKATELFPEYGAAHYSLALAYRRLGRDEAAKPHFRLSEEHKLTIPPRRDPVLARVRQRNAGALDLIQAGLNFEKEGDLEQAVEAHLRALEVDPRIAQAHVNLISLYARLGDAEKAERHYQSAMEINPDLPDCHYNYGVLLYNRNDLPGAEKCFRNALEINPYYAEAHNNLGVLLERKGDTAAAEKHYRAAVENKPDYRLAHFHLGRVLTNRRRFAEGIAHFKKTLEPEDTQTSQYLYALGAAYARAGDGGNAARYLRLARDSARSHDQRELLASIEHSLNTLQKMRDGH